MKLSKLLYIYALESSQTNVSTKSAQKFIEKMKLKDLDLKKAKSKDAKII